MEATRLAAIPLFSDLGRPELEALAAATSEVTAAPGDVVVAEGDFGHALYAIESGTAEARKEGTSLRDLGPGVAAGRRTASVVATSQLRLIAIFKRDVWALERRSPETAERLRSLIAGRRDAEPTP